MEIERKYLVKYPTLSEITLMENLVVKDIVQIYLHEKEKDVERRIRKVCTKDSTTCYYTEKRKHSEFVREEKERVISVCEYLKLVLEAITSLKEIKKYRFCFTYENQNFELDIYPGHNSQAILEIELKDESQKVNIPPFIHVIKDVTHDSSYKNSRLAVENILE